MALEQDGPVGRMPLSAGLSHFGLSHVAMAGLIGLALYGVGLATYRLVYHPLAKFPGPRRAAVTGWYEALYAIIKHGTYSWEIERMHEKYGPIVRVSPEEISIWDPEFHNQVYVGANVRKTDRHGTFGQGLGFDGSHFMTVPHDLHKQRRRPMEPFFSRAGIRKIEPLLAALTGRFERRLLEKQGSIVSLDDAFSAYSGDVIRSIAFEGTGYLMDDPDFSPDWGNTILTLFKSSTLSEAFPWLFNIILRIPDHVLAKVFPTGQAFLRIESTAREHINQVKREGKEHKATVAEVAERPSVIRAVMNSNLPEDDLSVDRLVKEAKLLFVAGTATTSHLMSFLVYYILANPHIKSRLSEELEEPVSGYPDRFPALTELEALPYLSALVKEGQRLSIGVIHRLPRCFPDTAIQYKQWVIPPNTPIGMSAYANHMSPDIYPDPHSFKPERWFGDIDPRMDKYLVFFAKGSRSCLGQNLALCELHFMLAVLFRPGGPGMRLFETDESDVKRCHDYVLAMPRLDSKGVRVEVV